MKSSENQNELKNFLQDVQFLCAIPGSKKFVKLQLPDYPFDLQLLSQSPLYRQSRKLYLDLGGVFSARVSSTMRSLSAQDLFKDEIEYTPSYAEILWFKDHHFEVVDPLNEIEALSRFNEISLFHEQNHRVIWRLLPPPPTEERDLSRYLNFAESLVVILDLALGDQLGRKSSSIFERIKVIYRSGGQHRWLAESKKVYRQYLFSLLCSTYYVLEMTRPEDILPAIDYVFPGQKKMNRQAVQRSLEISELFTRITNPQWQERFSKQALTKLQKLHQGSEEAPLYLPEDPLDLEEEFTIASRVFDFYGL